MVSKEKYHFDIVFYILRDWQTYHRRAMIEAFARNARSLAKIMVVEPPLCIPVHLIVNPKRVYLWRKTSRYEKVFDNLWVTHPYSLVPNSLGNCFLLKGLYNRFLSRQIQSILQYLDFKTRCRFAYITRPDHEHFVGLAEETHLIYECRDNHSYRPGDGQKVRSLERRELQMLKRASAVFASSRALFSKMSHLHPNTHLMPNGVDFDLFSTAQDNNLPTPLDLEHIPHPRIGYIGSIWPPFDFSLLDYLARARPNWAFVLIGPAKDVPAEIRRLRNLYFVGKKRFEELPAYLKDIDVAILPRILNPHTDHQNPLKFWEYLAAGKLVVSTALTQARFLQDVILVSEHYRTFLENIERALSGKHYEKIEKGIKIAAEHSWNRVTPIAINVLTEIAAKGSSLRDEVRYKYDDKNLSGNSRSKYKTFEKRAFTS